MNHPWRRKTGVARVLLLAIFPAAFGIAQQASNRADPARDFYPSAGGGATIQAGTVVLLPEHGNNNGGKDHGYSNFGIIFGARVYGDSMVNAIELFYYVPSGPDRLYREGDSRASTGRIGGDRGTDLGGYYCPAGYAAVGVQGASGMGVDRVGLICGKVGELSRVVALPVLGGRGGNVFKESCDRTHSSGYLTGVRVRSGAWMDLIQGLCQARE